LAWKSLRSLFHPAVPQQIQYHLAVYRIAQIKLWVLPCGFGVSASAAINNRGEPNFCHFPWDQQLMGVVCMTCTKSGQSGSFAANHLFLAICFDLSAIVIAFDGVVQLMYSVAMI
jgi:hypothetical protein